MLLASSDVPALQPLTTRLVAAGIPIALCKDPDLSSYLEVWIQRDTDFSVARRILVEVVGALAAAQSRADGQTASIRQEESASRGGVWGVASGVGRLVDWLRRSRGPGICGQE